ncbi:RNA-dependent RNA polymerase [Caerostris darwini]|uniref:RNA-dependent RNA polymerase n=1 Tax=Caerostris darwini TaxID=1538125 RepID=A0AAV4QP37_9ARAC|nr:RNA-dependent RNA polymerase [Caerostris darwini]
MLCKNFINCTNSFSPIRLILKFLKFYATELCPDVGCCKGYQLSGNFKGFRELTLQSIALRTYASLAITNDTHYIGLKENEEATLDDNSFEEGDPIRVSVTEDFEALLKSYHRDVLSLLKKLSGVKDIFISAESDFRNNWFLLVQSLGKEWHRLSLEELIMDEDITTMIKSRLKNN